MALRRSAESAVLFLLFLWHPLAPAAAISAAAAARVQAQLLAEPMARAREEEGVSGALLESESQSRSRSQSQSQSHGSQSRSWSWSWSWSRSQHQSSGSLEVLQQCESCSALLDYPRLLRMAPLGRATAAALFLWVLLLLWLLNDTAQVFFVPPLMYWSRLLRLPPEMAGATLLALGNGAPDLFSVLSATEARDTSLALSLLLGAMMTDICITAGGVLLAFDTLSQLKLSRLPPISPAAAGAHLAECSGGPEAEAEAEELKGSDYTVSAVWLSLAMLWFAFMLRDGAVTQLEAAFMPCLYVLYLIALGLMGIYSRPGTDSGQKVSQSPRKDKRPPAEGAAAAAPAAPPATTTTAAAGADAKAGAWPGERTSEERLTSKPPPLEGLASPEDCSLLGRLLHSLLWPTYAVRWVLIPPSDEHWDWDRRVVSSMAPCAFLGLLALTYLDGVHSLVSSAAMALLSLSSVAAGLLILFGGVDGGLPWFYPALTLLAKASSILVLSVIAGELTACVETLGLLNGVPRLWLGTTVVAWGNSLGDLVTGIAVARQGRIRMAFTGVLASPLFNLLCGAGGALCALCSSSGGRAVLWSSTAGRRDLRMHACFLLASCSALLIILLCRRGASLVWPAVLFLLYGIFIISILSAERAEG